MRQSKSNVGIRNIEQPGGKAMLPIQSFKTLTDQSVAVTTRFVNQVFFITRITSIGSSAESRSFAIANGTDEFYPIIGGLIE